MIKSTHLIMLIKIIHLATYIAKMYLSAYAMAASLSILWRVKNIGCSLEFIRSLKPSWTEELLDSRMTLMKASTS